MNNILTVSELTNDISSVLDELGILSIKGEISNYKHHSSGHRYFTLKDENAQIACTMWKSRQLNFQPTDGLKVVVTGAITVYPARGNYQIDCISITPLGVGDLYLAYEALKKKLDELGYFDAERKRDIPLLPMSVGIATSPTGAAVNDMFTTIKRRFPAMNIYFRPTIVQGEDAAPSIVAAIRELENSPAELIIVGRGGGSIEDLWAFNMESVADAIYKCDKPVISAVGHETDFTIADFVADLRAATPTAAAELVTPHTQFELLQNIEEYKYIFGRLVERKFEEYRTSVENIWGKNLKQRIYDRIGRYNQRSDDLENRINKEIKFRLKSTLQTIDNLDNLMLTLHPLKPLSKGFALLKYNNRVITNSDSLANIRNVDILRENESAKAKILQVLPKQLFNS
jgi:exodeoxyribonuclease VII large subunit